MIQRVQTLWMVLTVVLVCVVIFLPVVSFSMGGVEFRLMSYGIRGGDGAAMVVLEGVGNSGQVVISTLSVCAVALLVLAAFLPLVTIFLYKNRLLQTRLLGAEFALILGAAALLAWHVLSTYKNIVARMSENYFFSFFPLLLVIALLANWFAIRGVLNDEILIRTSDRIR